MSQACEAREAGDLAARYPGDADSGCAGGIGVTDRLRVRLVIGDLNRACPVVDIRPGLAWMSGSYALAGLNRVIARVGSAYTYSNCQRLTEGQCSGSKNQRDSARDHVKHPPLASAPTTCGARFCHRRRIDATRHLHLGRLGLVSDSSFGFADP